MQEDAWKKSSKTVSVVYLGEDGKQRVDERAFHCSYLKWVQKQHTDWDDECVPQDSGMCSAPAGLPPQGPLLGPHPQQLASMQDFAFIGSKTQSARA